MRKLLVYSCIFGFFFFLACAKPKSAVDHWKEQYGTSDPVDNMRYPKRTTEAKPENGKVADETGKEKTGPKKENETLVDESLLKKIPKQTELKSVRITADKVPLLKGPGARFEKIGEANSGDLFSLLRTLKGPEGETTWHQIQDDKGNKFFVADSQTVIVPHMEKIKRSEKTSIEKIQTIFDPTPPLPKELVEAKTITLNFEQTEIYDVITTFCELLKIDYMIEGGIAGKITLQTFNNIPVEDLYSVLEQILAVNNVTVVKSGNFYRFLPVKDAITKPLSIYYGDQANIPQNDRLIIQIIPLKHVSVNSMKVIIAPLLTKNATFLDVPETRNLMIVELASNLKRIVKVVQALDVDQLAQSDVHHYKIEHADAFSLAGEINSVFSVIGYKESLGKSLIFLPIDRLNSILVVSAFPDLWPTIELWIQKLDQPYLMTRKMGTFIYFVQNGDASRLAGILSSIFRPQAPVAAPGAPRMAQKPALPGVSAPKPFAEPPKETAPKPPVPGEVPQTPAAPPATGATGAATTTLAPTVTVSGGILAQHHEEGLDEDVKNLIVISDKDTNALVIRINPRSYPAILEILTKLDLMPQQVMIEVLIMDLTLDHSTLTGLEWAMKNTGKLNYSVGNQGLSNAGKSLGGLLGTSATSLFTSGVSFFVTDPSKFIALLQAFASDSKANVLANPVLVTTNNKAANIAITNEIPIVTTTATPSTSGSQISEQVQFRSVGVKLTIDPKINKENYVHLKIQQEISSRGVDVRNQPSFNNRTLNSEVVLKDNQILVMGGLMQTTVTTSNQGAPGLKDIPLLGRLFGTNSDALNKTELMIFISPHIISNREDADYVTNHVKYRLTDFSSLKNKTASLAQPGENFMKDFEDLEKPGEPDKLDPGNESSQANGKSKSAIAEFLESQKPGNGVPEKTNGGKPEPAKPKNGGAGKSNSGNSRTNGGTAGKK